MLGCGLSIPQHGWGGQEGRNCSQDPVQRAMPWALKPSVSGGAPHPYFYFLCPAAAASGPCSFQLLSSSGPTKANTCLTLSEPGFIWQAGRGLKYPICPVFIKGLQNPSLWMDSPCSPHSSVRAGQGDYRNPSKTCVTGDSRSLQCYCWEWGDRKSWPRLPVSPQGQSTLLSNPAFVTATTPRRCCAPGPGRHNGRLHGSETWIRRLQGERSKDERKEKWVPRNESNCPNAEISTFYSLPPQLALLLPSLLPPMPLGRASTSPPQRAKRAYSGCLTFPALSYKLVSKPETPFPLVSQQSHLLKTFRDIQHLSEFFPVVQLHFFSPLKTVAACNSRDISSYASPRSQHLVAGKGKQRWAHRYEAPMVVSTSPRGGWSPPTHARSLQPSEQQSCNSTVSRKSLNAWKNYSVITLLGPVVSNREGRGMPKPAGSKLKLPHWGQETASRARWQARLYPSTCYLPGTVWHWRSVALLKVWMWS